MAEILNASFPGSSLPGTMSSDHRVDGSHSVSGGQLSVTSTATANSKGIVRQTTPVAMDDGDTATIKLVSGTPFFAVIGVRTASEDATFYPAMYANGSGDFVTAYYRISNGYAAPRVTLPSIATSPWVRFRRSGLTSMIVETAPDVSGEPGTWTVRDTFLQSDGVWTAAWGAAQVEASAQFGAGSLVLAQIGTGGGGGGPGGPVTSRRRRLMMS